jgi:hypothetical protein
MDSFKTTVHNFYEKQFVPFALMLSIGGFLVALVGAYAISDLKNTDYVSVTGTAEQIVQSDSGKWTFTIGRTSTVQAYAYTSKLIHDDMENIAKYLVNRGVKRESITVAPLTSTTLCASQNEVMYDTNGRQQCTGAFTYSLSQVITVESDDVTTIRDLSLNAANALAAQNVQIMTRSVDYFYTKLNDLRVELLSNASKNARERAQALVKSSGSNVGALTQASQGVFQITPVNSTEISDYGTYDTSTIEKKVTAVVRASFRVR